MNPNAFHFEIKGAGAEPASVPLRDLLQLLTLLNGALLETGRGRNLRDADLEYTLTRVWKGDSSDYEIGGTAAAMGNADVLTRAIANRSEFLQLPEQAQENVRGMWRWVVSHGYDALAFAPNGSGITPAVISVDDELPSERPTYRGRTTLYGYCFRAGGEKHRRSAQLRLFNNKVKTVRLKTADLAKEVGGRLFETIGLTGEATWDAATDELEVFQADGLTPFRDHDPGMTRPRTNVEAFADLAEAAGDRWDNVDVDEFVRELRRD